MELLKLIYVGSALLSISGFIARGVLLMRDSPIMKMRWIKVVPHCIDSVLLISAIMLAVQYGFSPFNSPWLAAKIIALLIYIGLGVFLLRFASNNRMRFIALLIAIATFVYIGLVAVSKTILI